MATALTKLDISKIIRDAITMSFPYVGEVRSSYGELLIHADGTVFSAEACDGADGDDGGAGELHLKSIRRFNLVEYLQTYGLEGDDRELPEGFDILDLGYWYEATDSEGVVSVKYEPPEYQWRKDVSKPYSEKET
jgi:hypothetical protein